MADVELILLQRVEKLGQMGDVVQVRPGYARNFPDAKYVPVPDSLISICRTADGIHLNEYSAWVFAKYFRDYFYKLDSK